VDGLGVEGVAEMAARGAELSGIPCGRDMSAHELVGRVRIGRTFMRYSTARSALLKLAFMARMTCSLGNPMLQISVTAVSSAGPERNDELRGASPAGWAAAAAGPGASGATEVVAVGAGVSRGAGTTTAGAGVAGTTTGAGVATLGGFVIITTQN
jgi:hypothetical protein